MKKIKEIMGRPKKKAGRPSVQDAILKVYEDNPKGEYDCKELMKIMDERYAFRPSKPAVVNARLMELTRKGVLLRRPLKREGGRELYYYHVRKPGE